MANGQGVSVFTLPKLKRLMEDENLRQLVCCRLNFGLDRKHSSEEEFLDDIVSLFHYDIFLIFSFGNFFLVSDDQPTSLQRRIESTASVYSRIGAFVHDRRCHWTGVIVTSFGNRSYSLLGEGSRGPYTELWSSVTGKKF